ncbi:ATP-grasp domain-containing protein [Archangium violaceum]|uniref:ATP-grasp domain-containing protein n=1 Tax=Archangium violaceum TaxID=83451 RepID=UPI0019528154|nr:ATP-grasp domain-containing protein [Archangium violaceum]QRN93987.1 ATP-grasp domain-containing protein [Archangium violaceum]
MPVLLLSPRFSSDSIALATEASRLSWRVHRLHDRRPPARLAEEDLVFYGESLLADTIGKALGLALLEPAADTLSLLPEELVRRDVRFTTLGAARGERFPRFVKPADEKQFRASVYHSGAELPGPEVLEDGLPVLTAEPVCWLDEYRCFVLEGRVVTASPYAWKGEREESSLASFDLEGARTFAAEVLARAGDSFPSAVVLDVGRIEGRGWAVVELNPAWSSGLYACDAAGVLRVLQRASGTSRTVASGDARWLRPLPNIEG